MKRLRVGRQRNHASADLDVGQLDGERGLAARAGSGLGRDDAAVGAGAARGDDAAVGDEIRVEVALEALAGLAPCRS